MLPFLLALVTGERLVQVDAEGNINPARVASEVKEAQVPEPNRSVPLKVPRPSGPSGPDSHRPQGGPVAALAELAAPESELDSANDPRDAADALVTLSSPDRPDSPDGGNVAESSDQIAMPDGDLVAAQLDADRRPSEDELEGQFKLLESTQADTEPGITHRSFGKLLKFFYANDAGRDSRLAKSNTVFQHLVDGVPDGRVQWDQVKQLLFTPGPGSCLPDMDAVADQRRSADKCLPLEEIMCVTGCSWVKDMNVAASSAPRDVNSLNPATEPTRSAGSARCLAVFGLTCLLS